MYTYSIARRARHLSSNASLNINMADVSVKTAGLKDPRFILEFIVVSFSDGVSYKFY